VDADDASNNNTPLGVGDTPETIKTPGVGEDDTAGVENDTDDTAGVENENEIHKAVTTNQRLISLKATLMKTKPTM
jgi:hypothetical protein